MRIIFFVCLVSLGLLLGRGQLPPTSRVTSDVNIHGIYYPPNDQIHVEFYTNTIPMVVRVEVSSNVWRRTIWYNNGRAQTNEALMASNIVNCVTNTL